MVEKPDWVDYANLAANVVQTAQLDSINSKMRQMGELELQKEYREQQEKQTAAAADAVRLARIRYNSGSTSYLEVLTTDTNLYNSQLTLEAAEQAEALSLVQLYNALGGGW